MLNLITPPTDNLYKFIALSGLLLIILSNVLPGVQANKLMEKVFDLNFEIESLEIDLSLMDPIHNSDDEALYSENKDTKVLEDIKELFRSAEFRVESKETQKTFIDTANKYLKMENNFERLKFYSDDLKGIKILMWIGNILGLYLTALGFSLWYSKIQKYQDQKLILEAKGKK